MCTINGMTFRAICPFSFFGPNIFLKIFLSNTNSLLIMVSFNIHVSHEQVETCSPDNILFQCIRNEMLCYRLTHLYILYHFILMLRLRISGALPLYSPMYLNKTIFSNMDDVLGRDVCRDNVEFLKNFILFFNKSDK